MPSRVSSSSRQLAPPPKPTNLKGMEGLIRPLVAGLNISTSIPTPKNKRWLQKTQLQRMGGHHSIDINSWSTKITH